MSRSLDLLTDLVGKIPRVKLELILAGIEWRGAMPCDDKGLMWSLEDDRVRGSAVSRVRPKMLSRYHPV